MKLNDWKTTLIGSLTIIVAIADAAKDVLATGQLGDVGLLISSLTAGIGLIFAKDSNK